MNKIEIIGLVASVFIIMCSVVKSHTIKGNIVMRALNTIGSILFVVYGFVLGAWSTMITNCVITLLSVYYLIKLLIEFKKEKVTKNI